MNTACKNPFKIGDIVYVIGKYMPDSNSPLKLMECKISHIKNRQFVAYRKDGECGEWKFSKKHFNKYVFKDKTLALIEFKNQGGKQYGM